MVLLIEFEIDRKQHSALDIQKVGSHLVELGEIPELDNCLRILEVGEKLLGDLPDGNIINIYFGFLDEKEQKIQRTFENRSMERFSIALLLCCSLHLLHTTPLDPSIAKLGHDDKKAGSTPAFCLLFFCFSLIGLLLFHFLGEHQLPQPDIKVCNDVGVVLQEVEGLVPALPDFLPIVGVP